MDPRWTVTMLFPSDFGMDLWRLEDIYEGNNFLRAMFSALKARLKSKWVIVEWRQTEEK